MATTPEPVSGRWSFMMKRYVEIQPDQAEKILTDDEGSPGETSLDFLKFPIIVTTKLPHTDMVFPTASVDSGGKVERPPEGQERRVAMNAKRIGMGVKGLPVDEEDALVIDASIQKYACNAAVETARALHAAGIPQTPIVVALVPHGPIHQLKDGAFVLNALVLPPIPIRRCALDDIRRRDIHSYLSRTHWADSFLFTIDGSEDTTTSVSSAPEAAPPASLSLGDSRLRLSLPPCLELTPEDVAACLSHPRFGFAGDLGLGSPTDVLGGPVIITTAHPRQQMLHPFVATGSMDAIEALPDTREKVHIAMATHKHAISIPDVSTDAILPIVNAFACVEAMKVAQELRAQGLRPPPCVVTVSPSVGIMRFEGSSMLLIEMFGAVPIKSADIPTFKRFFDTMPTSTPDEVWHATVSFCRSDVSPDDILPVVPPTEDPVTEDPVTEDPPTEGPVTEGPVTDGI